MSHDAPTSPHGSTPYPAPYPSPYPGAPEGAAPTETWRALPSQPPLAGWWSRVGASVLDSLVTSVPFFAAGMIGLLTSEPRVDQLGQPSPSFTAAGGLAVMLGFALTVAVSVWNRILRQGRRGQSLGKQALGIRLVSARITQPIGAAPAFGREIAHLLDGVFYVGYLWPLWDPQKQTFADKIVGSVVVRAR
jgi:uncharacterized RDD family membrane protein YckC